MNFVLIMCSVTINPSMLYFTNHSIILVLYRPIPSRAIRSRVVVSSSSHPRDPAMAALLFTVVAVARLLHSLILLTALPPPPSPTPASSPTSSAGLLYLPRSQGRYQHLRSVPGDPGQWQCKTWGRYWSLSILCTIRLLT